MKYKPLALAGLSLVSMISGRASAAVVLSDNFDSYADTSAFTASWPAVTGGGATLSTVQASSPPKSVLAAGIPQRSGKSFTETSNFATSGNLGIGDQIIFSFDFYDEAPAAAPYRQIATLQDGTAPSATNQLVSMGLNNNQTAANSGGQFYLGRILGYTVPVTPDPDGGPVESVGGAGAFFKLNDFGVGLRSLGWHNLKVEITTSDELSTDYAFYVDNVLAEKVLDVGAAASIRSYDVIRIGSGLSSLNQAYYDNVYLEFIPFFIPGDFDDDDDVDVSDYLNLSTNLFTDVSGLTTAQSYMLGDITADLKIDGRDFAGFCVAYDDFNGLGALAAILAAVPEPSAGLLAGLGCGALCLRRGAGRGKFRAASASTPSQRRN